MSSFLEHTAAVVAALSASPALAGGRIRRGRRVPVPQEHASAIDVYAVRSEGSAQYLADTITRWETLIGVDLYARAAAGADAETTIDALLADTFARLATAAPPAGGAAWTLEPAITWDVSEADQTLVVASLSVRVSHYTAAGSLSAVT